MKPVLPVSDLVRTGLVCAGLACALDAAAQKPVAVGRISGGDLRISGRMELAPDGSALLFSGAEVEVRVGTARLGLDAGEARFCAPLKVTVLKGSEGDGPILFAIDGGSVGGSDSAGAATGSIELQDAGTAAHTVQTPFFAVVAAPSLPASSRRVSIRVALSGDTCVAAIAGSFRVREHLGPAEMLIPPGKAMLVPAAGVDKASPVDLAACSCGAPAALVAPQIPESALGSTGLETKTTVAAAPLVFQADPRVATRRAASNEGQRPPAPEPQVTLPVVTAGPPAGETDTGPKPVATPPAPQPDRSGRGFGAKLKRFFRALLGMKK